MTNLNIYRKPILLGALLLLEACSAVGPSPVITGSFPPKGPPNYQQGMVDGCKTAHTAVGSYSLYGLFFTKYYYNVDQGINDHVYAAAWEDGFHYCKYMLDGTLLT